jgi:DNA-binding CsgD family transcriptional regulator
MQDDSGSDASRQLLCVVDAGSRVSAVGAGASGLLGWRGPPVDSRLRDVVHPGDAPRLMRGLSRTGTGRREQVLDLRVRGIGGGWVPARCQLSPLEGQEPLRYVVAIRLSSPGAEDASVRATRLEAHLWRIALEVLAAGIADRTSLPEAWWAVPEVAELSERQAEILRRVVSGQRIAAMAEDLNLAESTVRNHLSSIYVKFGVQSQASLLARLMQGPGGQPHL